MHVREYLRSEDGQAMAEYAMIFSCVVIASFGALNGLQRAVLKMYSLMSDKFTAALG